MVLAEWHIEPEQIFETWTEEKFDLLLKKRNRRIDHINRQQSGEEEEPEMLTMDKLREAARQRYLASIGK